MEEFNERYFSDQPENLSFCFVNFFRKYVHFRDILRIHTKITQNILRISVRFPVDIYNERPRLIIVSSVYSLIARGGGAEDP